jgi:predicted metal-dependent hydrolase
MAVKHYLVENIGKVSLYKRKSSKSFKLSISNDGVIKLSMPYWTPYASGLTFIRSHRKWIEEHSAEKKFIDDGDRIGKAHVISVEQTTNGTITTRIKGNEIKVYVPMNYSIHDHSVQQRIILACNKTLKKEADELLPKRLAFLAQANGFEYRKVTVRNLKSRWGSCNNFKDISLSYYLIQLPWELIDYVILHELIHTKELSHNSNFWNEFEKILPNCKKLKKEVNKHQTTIVPIKSIVS